MNTLIRLALARRTAVLIAAALVLFLGVWVGRQLPVEVLPDLTKPTVVILTESPGLAPEEVEAHVTVPLERALLGIAGVTRLRSQSDVALSLIYVEFGWGADIYRARQFVQERLQGARASLPPGVEPVLTPVASLMGEIMLVGLRSTNDLVSASDVRTLADWVVRPRLQSLPGVAEVLNMGGGIRQLRVEPDPRRMQAHGITYDELSQAAAGAVGNTTGGFLERGTREVMVRNLAMTVDPEEIGRTVVRTVGDRPVRIADVADVRWGLEPMRGDGSINGTRGVVVSVTKAPGFDTRTLTVQIEAALAELRSALPPGVEVVVLFRQSAFIERAIGNLREALRDGGVMVALVLFLFLLNVRTTAITLTAIPLSFAVTLLVFEVLGISVNSMTLGGLAVAIGMVVDDAIVDVENVYRRLRENAARPEPRPVLEVVAQASREVRHSIGYATLLIVLVFLPLLGLTGVEGRLFAPIAVATMVSMAASFVVSLTVIPVLSSLLLRPKATRALGDPWLVRVLKRLLAATLLRVALGAPVAFLTSVAVAVVGVLAVVVPQLGRDFLPAFREETVLVSTAAAPGTSLAEMNRISDILEREILSVPEVRLVGRRLGRAERGDHVVPISTAEFDVEFHPEGEGGSARSRDEILADLRQRVRAVPGTFSVLTGPLADRIGHMMSGVSAPVAIKVFGPDPERLRALGTQIQAVVRTIPGLGEARMDPQASLPQLRIEPDRERAAAYGFTPGGLTETLAGLVAGTTVGMARDGARTVDLVLRLPDSWREESARLAQLPLPVAAPSGGGAWVPLDRVADVREGRGPNVIFRENSQRRLALSLQPTARDVATRVTELQQAVAERVKLPESYFLTFEGEFQARADASRRITWLSLAVFAVIAVLLQGYFRAPFLVAQVLADIPLALVGGVLLTWAMVGQVSVATLVGFIAVAGIAARNSILMLSHYLHLLREADGHFTRELVVRGTQERLVPVLMTALSAGIGLLPLVLAADQPGKEILHPIAVVIVGGLVTSTLLGLGVTPAVFSWAGRRAAAQALARGSPAAQ